MITTIDNNQRVFLIKRKGFSNRDYFVNLKDIPTILQNELEKHDEFTISHYWNEKFKRISKKDLNEMFENNKIDFRLK